MRGEGVCKAERLRGSVCVKFSRGYGEDEMVFRGDEEDIFREMMKGWVKGGEKRGEKRGEKVVWWQQGE